MLVSRYRLCWDGVLKQALKLTELGLHSLIPSIVFLNAKSLVSMQLHTQRKEQASHLRLRQIRYQAAAASTAFSKSP